MPPTVKSLDDRINDLVDTVISTETRLQALEKLVTELGERLRQLELAFTDFRSRGENTFAFLKWIGRFIAGAFLSSLFLIAGVILSTGQLYEKVNTQTKNIEKLADEQKLMAADIKRLADSVARIEEAVKAKK